MFRDWDYAYDAIAPEGFQKENTLTALARGDLSEFSFPANTASGELCLCWVCLFGSNPTECKAERIRSIRIVSQALESEAEHQGLTPRLYLNSLLEDQEGLPVGFGFITLFRPGQVFSPESLQIVASNAARLRTSEHTASVRLLRRAEWANAMNWYNQYYDRDSADSWRVFGQVWP